MSADTWKQQAAERALDFLADGMRVGLGTGTTAARFVDLVGARVKAGLRVGVPTSEATRAQAERLGIPLSTLDETPFLDLTVDGADELDGELRLIKGGGGALLREKIVATASERMIVIADASKRVQTLGAYPAPCRGRALRIGSDPQHGRGTRRRSRLRGQRNAARWCRWSALYDRQRQFHPRLRFWSDHRPRGARRSIETGARAWSRTAYSLALPTSPSWPGRMVCRSSNATLLRIPSLAPPGSKEHGKQHRARLLAIGGRLALPAVTAVRWRRARPPGSRRPGDVEPPASTGNLSRSSHCCLIA